ncbi:MAG TPA: hypothetical protein VHG91_05890 [Longimicrobium sp.]|nr:hypothetical protein [Longimicrobium sp.]
MPIFAMKSFLLYLVLVGLPLAGLFGILHLGNRLQAPPAVGGAWAVAAAPRAALPDSLHLSQSGVHLSVAAGGARLDGRVGADRVFASSAEGAGPCEAVLEARVDPAAGRMSGTLALPPSCAPKAFEAIRRPPAKRGEGH